MLATPQRCMSSTVSIGRRGASSFSHILHNATRLHDQYSYMSFNCFRKLFPREFRLAIHFTLKQHVDYIASINHYLSTILAVPPALQHTPISNFRHHPSQVSRDVSSIPKALRPPWCPKTFKPRCVSLPRAAVYIRASAPILLFLDMHNSQSASQRSSYFSKRHELSKFESSRSSPSAQNPSRLSLRFASQNTSHMRKVLAKGAMDGLLLANSDALALHTSVAELKECEMIDADRSQEYGSDRN
jgi:hypothetical protein